jgi:hypothetical protein
MIDQRAYSHIITFEYFLKKLAALGVPLSDTARALLAGTPLAKQKVRFHFGDIQLYVCEKIAEASHAVATPAPAAQRSARGADVPKRPSEVAVPRDVQSSRL